MTITFELFHQLIHRTDQNYLASGSRNYVYAKFDLLTDDWVAPITAVFGDYSVILDSENQCLIPWEVLDNPGTFSVSAFCGDLHTSTCTKVTVYPGGYIEGETPRPPTPSVYLQLIGLTETAVETANSVKQRADAGEFNGAQGETGPQGPKGQDGTVAFSDLTDQQKESLRGKSAYAYAQDGGFTGTEEEFAEKLATAYPTLSMLRQAVPTNLLDNSDFRHPVAQAGVKGKHGSQVYLIDRWKLVSGDAIYDASLHCITLTGKITQTLENVPSGQVSLFAKADSEQLRLYYADGVVMLETSTPVHIYWVALYEGDYTEETMPEYHPKGYAAELAECHRYFQIVENGTIRSTPTQDGCQLFANAVSPMRIKNPTATLINGGLVLTGVGNPKITEIENAYATSDTANFGCHYLIGTTVPGIPTQDWYHGYNWVTGRIDLNADL